MTAQSDSYQIIITSSVACILACIQSELKSLMAYGRNDFLKRSVLDHRTLRCPCGRVVMYG